MSRQEQRMKLRKDQNTHLISSDIKKKKMRCAFNTVNIDIRVFTRIIFWLFKSQKHPILHIHKGQHAEWTVHAHKPLIKQTLRFFCLWTSWRPIVCLCASSSVTLEGVWPVADAVGRRHLAQSSCCSLCKHPEKHSLSVGHIRHKLVKVQEQYFTNS